MLLVKQRVSKNLTSFVEALNDKNTNKYHVVERQTKYLVGMKCA
jgi:hypothetical protein